MVGSSTVAVVDYNIVASRQQSASKKTSVWLEIYIYIFILYMQKFCAYPAALYSHSNDLLVYVSVIVCTSVCKCNCSQACWLRSQPSIRTCYQPDKWHYSVNTFRSQSLHHHPLNKLSENYAHIHIYVYTYIHMCMHAGYLQSVFRPPWRHFHIDLWFCSYCIFPFGEICIFWPGMSGQFFVVIVAFVLCSICVLTACSHCLFHQYWIGAINNIWRCCCYSRVLSICSHALFYSSKK